MYKIIIRPILFLFNPEFIHDLVFLLLGLVQKLPPLTGWIKRFFSAEHPALSKTLMGINFPNPVGLAAGFDKNASVLDGLAMFGFGHIEIGTVTPVPQPGNPKPRLYRLKKDKALVNRMGFNNQGVERIVANLKKKRRSMIVGGNIGKNKFTPNENATDDYVKCFEALFDHVDYFVVNVSSPNTPGLRNLQDKEPLSELLSRLQETNNSKKYRKPILLKIAPDLSEAQLDDIVEIVRKVKLDGLVATNTTLGREHLLASASSIKKAGEGGLSGKPLRDRSNVVIRYLRKKLDKNVVIIGVGGVIRPEDALEKIRAGADLIQIYTGFIYEGPGIVKSIHQSIIHEAEKGK